MKIRITITDDNGKVISDQTHECPAPAPISPHVPYYPVYPQPYWPPYRVPGTGDPVPSPTIIWCSHTISAADPTTGRQP